MKCKRVSLMADVEKYELDKGMEDGFEKWSDVVTKGWINTDRLIKVERENGDIVCPYILHRRGRTFIETDDYIIQDSDGTKHVCGKDKIHARYEEV
ncbi:MAG: hypothetical protein K6G23_03060 [Lachnospiraceae bacterium]|nr:hypothetical protein [Lachnospiraceae bacterium]